MLNPINKYLSFFFLTLFLFPQVGKGIHQFNHPPVDHCTEAPAHFCNFEHSCDICDYSTASPMGLATYIGDFSILENKADLAIPQNAFVLPHAKFNLSLRAPPPAV